LVGLGVEFNAVVGREGKQDGTGVLKVYYHQYFDRGERLWREATRGNTSQTPPPAV